MSNRLPAHVLASFVLIASSVPALLSQTGVHPISGRVYAGTMGVAGAAWLDRQEREEEESPERALQLLAIPRGSTVADIGAGSGYFSLRMAQLVGPSGRVYATDIQQGMLDIIARKLEKQPKLTNVTLILGTQEDPKLPPASLDMALMVDVYHELQQPQVVLQRIRESLKPNGRLVLLEYRKEDPRIPIRPEHKMSVAEAKLEVEHEGFKLDVVNRELPWQHILIFRVDRSP